MEPNADNKLFVGGCPAGSGETDLRAVRTHAPHMAHAGMVLRTRATRLLCRSPQLFEKHGDVEEVFIMRGGSRSGMVCAFVRFASQPMAQAAIDAIHGRIALPNSAEPLVVRWADTPGSRRREGREGGRSKRSGAGGGAAAGAPRGLEGGMDSWAPPMMMGNGVYGGFPPQMMMGGHPGAQPGMMPQGAMLPPQPGLNASYGGPPAYYAQMGGAAWVQGGMMPPHMGGAGALYAAQQQMMVMEQGGALVGSPPAFWQMQPMASGPMAMGGVNGPAVPQQGQAMAGWGQ